MNIEKDLQSEITVRTLTLRGVYPKLSHFDVKRMATKEILIESIQRADDLKGVRVVVEAFIRVVLST